MKHRIYFSLADQLYKIETKRLLGKWETRNHYLYTNPDGNVIRASGFYTYESAQEWIIDRYPGLNLNSIERNRKISFEF